MNAAQVIVEKFGGQSALAELIGKGQSTVQYWTKSGVIPAKWQAQLLRLGRDKGIDISAADFVRVPEVPKKDEGEPFAEYSGVLEIGGGELPCYVLNDGRRVISRTGATGMLAGKKGGGQLEKYIGTDALKEYMPDLNEQMIDFTLEGIANKKVRGMEAITFLDVCRGYAKAFQMDRLETAAQVDMGHKAIAFLAACANVGLEALIDEATGYQYDRPDDALRVKLKAYLSDEMRKWESTFPEELWHEFARLTKWQGGVIRRPKYWGKLVMELVYGYLDPDVADWLRKNAPEPRHGQNYHQWLTKQYGLKKLVEHIWMVIGMARACKTMQELRDKKAEASGRKKIRVIVYVKPGGDQPSLFDGLDEVPKPAGESPQADPGESGQSTP